MSLSIREHDGVSHRFGPVRVADTDVFITSSDPDFAAVVRWSFSDLRVRPSDTAAVLTHEFKVHQRAEPWTRWAMWRDGEPCQLALEEGYVLFHLQWELNRIVLERRTTTIHSAAIDIGGRGVALVGQSMSGKTTLSAYLAAEGSDFVADEIVALTEACEIEPFPRPLGLRHNGPLGERFSHPDDFDRRFDRYEMLVPASALGATIAHASVPLVALVFPTFRPSASTEVTPLSRASALEMLCASSPGLSRHGRSVFRALASAVDVAQACRLEFSNTASARQAVIDFVG